MIPTSFISRIFKFSKPIRLKCRNIKQILVKCGMGNWVYIIRWLDSYILRKVIKKFLTNLNIKRGNDQILR